mmetsp:Transcript_67616/g.209197  ORF Transcript_67616/g.209197 Transcript_67616/m.209197 type:complete len:228 (-) Transcript_67616:310-993(-)
MGRCAAVAFAGRPGQHWHLAGVCEVPRVGLSCARSARACADTGQDGATVAGDAGPALGCRCALQPPGVRAVCPHRRGLAARRQCAQPPALRRCVRAGRALLAALLPLRRLRRRAAKGIEGQHPRGAPGQGPPARGPWAAGDAALHQPLHVRGGRLPRRGGRRPGAGPAAPGGGAGAAAAAPAVRPLQRRGAGLHLRVRDPGGPAGLGSGHLLQEVGLGGCDAHRLRL